MRSGGGGPVDPVGHVEAGEEPVVGGVLENIEGGHGGGGEAVDEERFEFAFEEVDCYEDEGEGLERGAEGGHEAVFEGGEERCCGCWGEDEEEEWVDEEGSEVFN